MMASSQPRLVKSQPGFFSQSSVRIKKMGINAVKKGESLTGRSNLARLQIVFSRVTVKQGLFFLHQLQLNDRFLKERLDLEAMMRTLDKPTDVLNALSVGLFAARFALNTGLMLQNVLLPTKEEQSKTYLKRLQEELKAKHPKLISDAVWGGVNALTNYAGFFHIPAAVANWTIVGFLVFDLALIFYQRKLAEEEYLEKKRHYEAQLRKPNLSDEEKKVIHAQLQALEVEWRATDAQLWFCITAALLLMGGFSAALFLNHPAAVPVCFLVCTIAIAMYASASAYREYKKQSLILQANQAQHLDGKDDATGVQAARNRFLFAMAKNTVVPMVIMGTFAVCWQAALLLAVSYIGLELLAAGIQHDDKTAAAQAPRPRLTA